jgi:hypothetical protein
MVADREEGSESTFEGEVDFLQQCLRKQKLESTATPLDC